MSTAPTETTDSTAATERTAVLESRAAWARRAQTSIYAHNLAAEHYSRRNGLANAVILGGVVTLGQTALVVDLSTEFAKAVVGASTVLLTVLSALTLLWDLRGKALEHRFAARQYGMIRRGLDVLDQASGDGERAWREQELRRQWDVASATAPNSPDRIRAKARALYTERALTTDARRATLAVGDGNAAPGPPATAAPPRTARP
jgi:hypothetical protein